MATATIGWQAMGKPDFSQCGKLFYRLPAAVRESLNRSEEKVLIWALFLSWWQTFHSGRTGALASFSETWLGTKFGKSRWTVLRALARLEGHNLLKRIRRNPKKDGTFQTNIIALSAKLLGVLGLISRQVPDKSPCSKSAPQEVGNGYKQERTATLHQSAGSSLSGFISDSARERTAHRETEEKRMAPGTLMKLYLQERAEKGR